jgi:hypothetical protein
MAPCTCRPPQSGLDAQELCAHRCVSFNQNQFPAKNVSPAAGSRPPTCARLIHTCGAWWAGAPARHSAGPHVRR